MAYYSRKRSRKKGKLLHVQDVLAQSHPELSDGDFEKICAQWKSAMPPKVFAVTRPVQVKNGTLIVHVENHSWLQELSFQKHKMTQALHLKIPNLQVRNLHFRVGKVHRASLKQPAKSFKPKPLPMSQIPETIARSLATIRDQKIRDQVKKLVSVSLSR